MDREKYLVRPFADRDYEPVARIDSSVNPELHFSAEEQRHWEAQFLSPQLVNEKWVVEERATGTVVAFGSMSHSPFSYDAHKFWASVDVDPAHRGRGSAARSLLSSSRRRFPIPHSAYGRTCGTTTRGV